MEFVNCPRCNAWNPCTFKFCQVCNTSLESAVRREQSLQEFFSEDNLVSFQFAEPGKYLIHFLEAAWLRGSGFDIEVGGELTRVYASFRHRAPEPKLLGHPETDAGQLHTCGKYPDRDFYLAVWGALALRPSKVLVFRKGGSFSDLELQPRWASLGAGQAVQPKANHSCLCLLKGEIRGISPARPTTSKVVPWWQ